MIIAPISFAEETVQVINVPAGNRIESISPSGHRQYHKITGIKKFDTDNMPRSILKKRLNTLIQGKTLQLHTVSPGQARISFGGQDIAERLLQEGVAEIDQSDIARLPRQIQQAYIQATESAYQHNRGLWQQEKAVLKRYHHPLWRSDGLPQPMTRAPVFVR